MAGEYDILPCRYRFCFESFYALYVFIPREASDIILVVSPSCFIFRIAAPDIYLIDLFICLAERPFYILELIKIMREPVSDKSQDIILDRKSVV